MNSITEKIKGQIIKELGLLSYLEKKKVRDSLDKEFIEKELAAIQKQKKQMEKLLIFWGAVSVLITGFVIYIFYFEPNPPNNSLIIFLLIVYLFNSTLTYISKTRLEKEKACIKSYRYLTPALRLRIDKKLKCAWKPLKKYYQINFISDIKFVHKNKVIHIVLLYLRGKIPEYSHVAF